MGTFHWQARGRDGNETEGELVAPSRQQALRELQERGLLVTALSLSLQPASAEPPPPLPRRTPDLTARLARERGRRPHRGRALAIAAGLAAAALAVGSMAPVTGYHCERDPAGVPACTVQQRPLGLYAWRQARLAGVTAVDDEEGSIPAYAGNGRTVAGFRTRLVVRDTAGRALALTGWDEPAAERGDVVGDTEAEVRHKLIDFLADPAAVRVSGWRGHWVPLLLASALLALAASMLVLLVLSLFAAPTRALYTAAARRAEEADRAAAAPPAAEGDGPG